MIGILKVIAGIFFWPSGDTGELKPGHVCCEATKTKYKHFQFSKIFFSEGLIKISENFTKIYLELAIIFKNES